MPRQFTRAAPYRVESTPHRQTIVAQVGGLDGVGQTMAYMRRFVNEYKTHPLIRRLAMQLIDKLPQKDYQGEAAALWNFVKFHIRYTKDVNGVETLQTPVKTLEFGQGDCDDKATLLACLLESIGHATRFRAVGFEAGSVCHVTIECKLGQQWVALETTEPVGMGWVPRGIRQNLYEHGQDPGAQELAGLFGSIKKFVKKSVKLGIKTPKDTVKSIVKNPLNPVEHLKTAVKGTKAEFKHSVADDPLLGKVAKIKGIGTILTVLKYLPPPWGTVAMVAAYAVQARQFLDARQAQIDMKKALKQLTMDDGTSVAQAQAQVNAERLKIDQQVAYANAQAAGVRGANVDNIIRLVVASEVVAGGLVLAYVARKIKQRSSQHEPKPAALPAPVPTKTAGA